jgi:hypothetical protein
MASFPARLAIPLAVEVTLITGIIAAGITPTPPPAAKYQRYPEEPPELPVMGEGDNENCGHHDRAQNWYQWGPSPARVYRRLLRLDDGRGPLFLALFLLFAARQILIRQRLVHIWIQFACGGQGRQQIIMSLV